ncbi:MAG: DinB family protein [Planctomycetota bacterium]
MNAKDAIRQIVEFSHQIVRDYVQDLTDAELLTRSVPNANHIAWQLGHLIAGDAYMLGLLGGRTVDLPADFTAEYTNETAGSDDPAKFRSKQEYLELADKSKAATLAAIDATPEGQLDQPGPEAMRAYAPTVAAALMILGTHWLMHAGQFVPIRRKLGRAPLF